MTMGAETHPTAEALLPIEETRNAPVIPIRPDADASSVAELEQAKP